MAPVLLSTHYNPQEPTTLTDEGTCAWTHPRGQDPHKEREHPHLKLVLDFPADIWHVRLQHH